MNQDVDLSFDIVRDLIILMAIYFVSLIVLSFLIVKILRIDEDENSSYRLMMIFSNIGFMGLPVIQSIYGQEYMVYAALFQIPFNILLFSYGIKIVKGTSDFNLKSIINPGLIGALGALFFLLVPVEVPCPIYDAVSIIGQVTTPVSMMVIGNSLASIPILELFNNFKLNIFTIIRLIVIPVAFKYILIALNLNMDLVNITVVMYAMPVASMVTMIEKVYGGNPTLSAKGTSLTTLLSVLTIPLVINI